LTKRKVPQYNQKTITAALAELDRNGGNLTQTGKKIGIPPSTIGRWARERARNQPPTQNDLSLLEDTNTSLADRLEQIVARMVAVMPEKVEEASLQELTRSLTTILTTMNQARAEQEQSGHLYDKFVQIMARFSNNGAAADNLPPSDGEGAH